MIGLQGRTPRCSKGPENADYASSKRIGTDSSITLTTRMVFLRQAPSQPSVPTRRRKCLIDLTPSFEHEVPVWELRVGVFRVFYDVAVEEKRVHIRAVRRKESPQRTEDII